MDWYVECWLQSKQLPRSPKRIGTQEAQHNFSLRQWVQRWVPIPSYSLEDRLQAFRICWGKCSMELQSLVTDLSESWDWLALHQDISNVEDANCCLLKWASSVFLVRIVSERTWYSEPLRLSSSSKCANLADAILLPVTISTARTLLGDNGSTNDPSNSRYTWAA